LEFTEQLWFETNVCSQHMNWTKWNCEHVYSSGSVHSARTGWAPTDLVSLQPAKSHVTSEHVTWLGRPTGASSPCPPLPLLTGARGITRGNKFGIKDAHEWVLEHFGRKNQHLCGPGFWLQAVTFEFPVNVLAAARIVKRWSHVLLKCVCDHLTEMPAYRWVIAAFQCCQLFGRGRLAVTLH